MSNNLVSTQQPIFMLNSTQLKSKNAIYSVGIFGQLQKINLYHAKLMMFSGTVDMPQSVINQFFTQSFQSEWWPPLMPKIKWILAKVYKKNCFTNRKYLSRVSKESMGKDFVQDLIDYQNLYSQNYRANFF